MASKDAETVRNLEAVNGKIDLGFRRLIVSHVENASTFYAYTHEDHQFYPEYKKQLAKLAQSKPNPVETIRPDGVYAVQSPRSKTFVRGRIENVAGPMKSEFLRVRLIDLGMTEFIAKNEIFDLNSSTTLKEMPIRCFRYKMAELKPKGQMEGFSAKERAQGAEWLKSIIADRPVKAKCHEVVNYKGGIWFEGEVDGKNLNLLAAQSGFCVPNPSTILKNQESNHPPAFQSWDRDYLSYGQHQGPWNSSGNNQGRWNNQSGQNSHQLWKSSAGMQKNHVSTIASSQYRDGNSQQRLPSQMAISGHMSMSGREAHEEVLRLKKTLKTLEQALSKRNREIESLKKNSSADENDTANSKKFDLSMLVDAISKAETLRKESKKEEKTKEDTSALENVEVPNKVNGNVEVPNKVIETVDLVKRVFHSLKSLTEKGEDTQDKLDLYNKSKSNPDSTPEELGHRKKDLLESIEGFNAEYDSIIQQVEEGCKTLEQVLAKEVCRPIVKLNVSQMSLKHRQDLVNQGVDAGVKWANNYADQLAKKNPEFAREASQSALDNFCQGLEDISSALKEVNSGIPLEKPLPSLSVLIKKTQSTFEAEISALGPQKEKASSHGFFILAKAIGVCLDEKTRVQEKKNDFQIFLGN